MTASHPIPPSYSWREVTYICTSRWSNCSGQCYLERPSCDDMSVEAHSMSLLTEMLLVAVPLSSSTGVFLRLSRPIFVVKAISSSCAYILPLSWRRRKSRPLWGPKCLGPLLPVPAVVERLLNKRGKTWRTSGRRVGRQAETIPMHGSVHDQIKEFAKFQLRSGEAAIERRKCMRTMPATQTLGRSTCQ